MKKQFDERNLTMVMDFYELTMANGYFKDEDKERKVAFDVFYRKNPDNAGYAIFAGLEQIIEYIENLHFDEDDIEYLRGQGLFGEEFLAYLADFKFRGDIYSFPEGTIMYPNEPVITVVAPLLDAQLVETAILLQVNHQSLIATATVLAGQMFNIPISGTMAHSWVMFYRDEFEAFKHYAENYPDATVLLVDTYDVVKSGIPNAIRCAKEVLEPMGKRLKGIRLDSGDLAYLSKKVRKMLDDAGLTDCKIVVSNSLDEWTIMSILEQGGCIDSFGVGERLITAKSDPVFGAVYKIAAVEENGVFQPRIKISENVEKITNPGLKKVYRIYDENKKAIADLIAGADEVVDLSKPYRYVDPVKPWKNRYFENCTAVELQQLVVKNGKRVMDRVSIDEIKKYVQDQLTDNIWEEEQRFENPHNHYLDMSPAYYDMKMSLLHKLTD